MIYIHNSYYVKNKLLLFELILLVFDMITQISKNLFKVYYPDVMDNPVFLTESQLRDCYNVLLDCGLIPS